MRARTRANSRAGFALSVDAFRRGSAGESSRHFMPRRVRERTRGFTLLELLAVMALIGLVLFFVIPNLDNMTPTARLKAAARKIGTTMELAQGEAVAEGKELTLAYDLSKGTYWIILPAPTPPPGSSGTSSSTTPTTQASSGSGPAPPPPDVEHDDKPLITTPTPSGSSGSTTAPPPPTAANYQNRETLGEDAVGDDVQIASITLPTGKEATSGVVYINFSSLGNEGSHSVLVQLRTANGAQSTEPPISVRFNALTRTVDFANQKLGFGSGQ